ncbi:MAG: VCBS repeat-containing protein [Cyclobacteriaceae bacterium]|nr:VCBS repeat-containing protein [Cyclobacteriaceae bacterium]
MRFTPLFFLLSISEILVLSSCETSDKKEERLAKKYCSTCHQFPDPSLLDKTTWKKGVLPQMAFRMGLNYSYLSTISKADYPIVSATLPDHAMLSEDEWQIIQQYFIKNAPDSLPLSKNPPTDQLTQFNPTRIAMPIDGFPLVTMVRTDTLQNKIYIGTRTSQLFKLNSQFALEDTITLSSPPSHMIFRRSGNPILSLMGIMDPNDQPLGEIVEFNFQNRKTERMIDSLKRPVHIEEVDLNNDGRNDFVVCAFGNYTGTLTAFENLGNGSFKKHIISPMPGSRRVIIKDINNDGLQDIIALLAQGDEQISLFTNANNFKFRIKTLLRFPPVYGSSYFDIADFNQDGKFDILYTNGDNADYSIILKPYHGIRIFQNDGRNQFTETWFYPMHGASQALAHDFNMDGRMDIAAISFFPNYKDGENGFLYFENTGKNFIAFSTPLASAGRWLVMEKADLEKDGDADIILGALDFLPSVPANLVTAWRNDRTYLLVLKNNQIKN